VSEGERKQVTVLFSDLSGFTAMSERLDPEDVRGVMSKLLSGIGRIIARYDGQIDKFIGDEVMALFGVPRAHEDDPVRAIRTALEIQEFVEHSSSAFEMKTGCTLRMHSGINTGLVVAGESSTEKGTEKVLGDTVNLASRLPSLAGPGEIVVGEGTFHLAKEYFDFEPLGPTEVKGKTKPIRVYRVLGAKDRRAAVHRLAGLQSELVGRAREMSVLERAAWRLHDGQRTVVAIRGDAGIGKSRMVAEFRLRLADSGFRWREGRCYAHTHDVPYFPIVDLLSRAWSIAKGDPPALVGKKLDASLRNLMGTAAYDAPIIGSLFGLESPELEDVEPAQWRRRLARSVAKILDAFASAEPTIIHFEDLHWADQSSVDLIRTLLTDTRCPAIFICVFRPSFSLFDGLDRTEVGKVEELELTELSPRDMELMLESLLDTERVPEDLSALLRAKAEGIPFYLEEVVNHLVGQGLLVHDSGIWKLTRPIEPEDVPPTIQGVVLARIDRLDSSEKTVLQEASVIGRRFNPEILARVTDVESGLQDSIAALEARDFIRTVSVEPEHECVFKNVLTQEVAYGSLLRADRKRIHERVGRVMEELLADRLPEFFEIIAYHYARGESRRKAVEYLMKSGAKAASRYAIDESHRCYQEAYDLSLETSDEPGAQSRLAELLLEWAYVFDYRGDFTGLETILRAHENLFHLGKSIRAAAMYAVWLGLALSNQERHAAALGQLEKAERLAQRAQDLDAESHVAAVLSLVYAQLGRLYEAVEHGERALRMADEAASGRFVRLIALNGLGTSYYFLGDCRGAERVGQELLDAGRRGDSRMAVSGYVVLGTASLNAGDFDEAVNRFTRAAEIAKEPFFLCYANFMLAITLVLADRFDEAEVVLQTAATFSEEHGTHIFGITSEGLEGMRAFAHGDLGVGVAKTRFAAEQAAESGHRYRQAMHLCSLGRAYLRLVVREPKPGLRSVLRNAPFLIRTLPVAGKRSEDYLRQALDIAEDIGARAVAGQALLLMGKLHAATGKPEQAADELGEAARHFEWCSAPAFLAETRECLAEVATA